MSNGIGRIRADAAQCRALRHVRPTLESRTIPSRTTTVRSDTRHDHPDPEERLDSWKAIASYLTRDVTTVQRWEKRESMPVHRHLHDKLGSVGDAPSPTQVALPNGTGFLPRLGGDVVVYASSVGREHL